jgi:glutaminase
MRGAFIGACVLAVSVAGCSYRTSPLATSASVTTSQTDVQAAQGTRTTAITQEGAPPRAVGPTPATPEAYRNALYQAYAAVRSDKSGKNADYIPALAKVDSSFFGIALATVDGAIYEIGSTKEQFSIQSVSKVFTLARAIELLGAGEVEKHIGVNATGRAFNSIVAVEDNKAADKPPSGNPLVNPGAIATVALLPGKTSDERWTQIISTYSAFAARPLLVNQEVYKSESDTNQRNRAIGMLLHAYEVIEEDPEAAVDVYTRQCSVNVTARDLAVMGATLANGGRNPLSEQQVVSPETAAHALAVMATAGLYEASGTWLYEVGAPAKSGVGGGIVAVVPGKFAIGTFSPPLDEAGNSVRGQKAIAHIITQLKANPLLSDAKTRSAKP